MCEDHRRPVAWAVVTCRAAQNVCCWNQLSEQFQARDPSRGLPIISCHHFNPSVLSRTSGMIWSYFGLNMSKRESIRAFIPKLCSDMFWQKDHHFPVVRVWHLWSLLSPSLPPVLGRFPLWEVFFPLHLPCSYFCLYLVPRLLYYYAISLSYSQDNQNKSPNHCFVDSFTFFHWTSVTQKHWSFGHCAKEQG